MGVYDRGSFSNGSFLNMYDKCRGLDTVRSTTEKRERAYLIELNELFPLVLPNAASRLKPPNLDPGSGENPSCHGEGPHGVDV